MKITTGITPQKYAAFIAAKDAADQGQTKEGAMKLLVATKETQGRRKDDFCGVPEGEIVMFGSTCDNEDVDGHCGCKRSMRGVKCLAGTTTMKVVEIGMPAGELESIIKDALEKGGWTKVAGEKAIDEMAKENADELRKVAANFKVGEIVERREDHFCSRSTIKAAAKPEPKPAYAAETKAQLTARAKAYGVKYFRIMNKEELGKVLTYREHLDCNNQERIINITAKALARWKAGQAKVTADPIAALKGEINRPGYSAKAKAKMETELGVLEEKKIIKAQAESIKAPAASTEAKVLNAILGPTPKNVGTITKNKFEAYVRVQESGVTNMFMLTNVIALSGLTKAECLDIMKNYGTYKEQYGGKEKRS